MNRMKGAPAHGRPADRRVPRRRRALRGLHGAQRKLSRLDDPVWQLREDREGGKNDHEENTLSDTRAGAGINSGALCC